MNDPTSHWRRRALLLYRVGALALIAWLVREHAASRKAAEVTLPEIAEFYSSAAELRPGESPAGGLDVFDASGEKIGMAARSMPHCKKIIGYSGNTDVLIALEGTRVLSVKIRSSEDTARYVDDIRTDSKFLKSWDGMSMKKAAKLGLDGAGIDAVSGATATSLAITRSVAHRLALELGQPPPARRVRVNWSDLGMLAIILAACAVSFTRLRGWNWPRRLLQLAVLAYIGFMNGDLIAINLLSGWARSGVPWDLAPGMVLLVAAALVVPLVTRNPLYCQQLCPHGVAQEWLYRITRGKLRVTLPRRLAAVLRIVPAVLLGVALAVTMLGSRFDLSQIEPFDAYNLFLTKIGWAALGIAAAGLLASMFVPMAYCKFGCPTGALLEHVRRRGPRDHFGRGDFAAAMLIALAVALFFVK